MQPLQDQIGHLQSEVQRLTAQVAGVEILRTEVTSLCAEVETLRTKLAAMATLEAEVSRLRDLTSTSADRTVVSVTTQSAKSAGKARAMYVFVTSTFFVVLIEAFAETCQMKRNRAQPHQWCPKLHQKLCNHILVSLHMSWANIHGTRTIARCPA